MQKTINPGKVNINNRLYNVFCHIKIEDGVLSICGVEGPKRNGDSYGACGQIEMGYYHKDESQNDKRYSKPTRISKFSDNWDEELFFKFLDIWHKWHLNDMRSGCEHQRQMGWTYEEHHNSKTYKGDKCPVCGYEIGSKWLR